MSSEAEIRAAQVAYVRTVAQARRDRRRAFRRAAGFMSLAQIANAAGLSKSRVAQLIAEDD